MNILSYFSQLNFNKQDLYKLDNVNNELIIMYNNTPVFRYFFTNKTITNLNTNVKKILKLPFSAGLKQNLYSRLITEKRHYMYHVNMIHIYYKPKKKYSIENNFKDSSSIIYLFRRLNLFRSLKINNLFRIFKYQITFNMGKLNTEYSSKYYLSNDFYKYKFRYKYSNCSYKIYYGPIICIPNKYELLYHNNFYNLLC